MAPAAPRDAANDVVTQPASGRKAPSNFAQKPSSVSESRSEERSRLGAQVSEAVMTRMAGAVRYIFDNV